jgi:acyl-coenzyme A thioesterase PaaI-like protein
MSHFLSIPDELPPGPLAEKRRLADVLRELVHLCVTTDAPAEELARATEAAEAVRARLGQHPGHTFAEAVRRPGFDLPAFQDRLTIIGPANPISPPVRFAKEGELSVGTVSFGPAFEGTPGFVHGGILAACFDQLFGHVEVSRGNHALTGTLTVHYKAPTPIRTPLRYEGRLDRADGKRSYLTGRIVAEGQVTAEAEGVFIAVDPSKLRSLWERRG